MLPDSLLSQIFRGFVLECRIVSKLAREVAYSSGSVESPLFLRIRKSEGASLDVVNLNFLRKFQHLSCLICSEEFNLEIDPVIKVLSGDLALEIVQELTVSEVEIAAAQPGYEIVSLAQKLVDQKFPLPANCVLHKVLIELDFIFENFNEDEVHLNFFDVVSNFALRVLFHQASSNELMTSSIDVINSCVGYTEDRDNGVHEVVVRTGLIPFLVDLKRNGRSESRKQCAWEALLRLTRTSSETIGILLISNIAIEDLFPTICSDDCGQAEQALRALHNLAECGIGCKNSLVRAGVREPLVTLLRTGAEKYREEVACIFMHLTNCDAQLKAVLASEGLGAVLVDMARTDCQKLKSLAHQGLLNLTAGGLATVSPLRQAGVVDLAVDLAWFPSGSKSDDRSTATRILLNIASNRQGVGRELSDAGVVDAMVAVARSEPDSPWDCCRHQAIRCLEELAMDSIECGEILLQLIFAGAVRIFVKGASVAGETSERKNAVLALFTMGQSYLSRLATLRKRHSTEVFECRGCLRVMKLLFSISDLNSEEELALALGSSVANAVALASLVSLKRQCLAVSSWAAGFMKKTREETLAVLQAHGSAQPVVQAVLKAAMIDCPAIRDFSTAILSMFADQPDSQAGEGKRVSWRALLQAPGALPDLVARARTGASGAERLPSLLVVLLLAVRSDSAAAALVEAGGLDVLDECDAVLRLWLCKRLRLPGRQSPDSSESDQVGPGSESPAALPAKVPAGRCGKSMTAFAGGARVPWHQEQLFCACLRDSESGDPAVRAGGLESLAAAIWREARASGGEARGGGGEGLVAERVAKLVGRLLAEEDSRKSGTDKRALYSALDVGHALFTGMRGAARRVRPAVIRELLRSLLRLLGSSDGPCRVGPHAAALGPLGLGACELVCDVMGGADPTPVLVALLRLLSGCTGKNRCDNTLANNAGVCLAEMCRRVRGPAAAGALRVGCVLRELHRLFQAHPASGDTWAHPPAQWGVLLLSTLVDSLGDELLGQLPRCCRRAESALGSHLDRLLSAARAARTG